MQRTYHDQNSQRQIAFWIDHLEAIPAIFKDAHLLHEEKLFPETGLRTHGGGWSHKRIEAHRQSILNHFNEEIVQNLIGADEIIIYGRGHAKHELYQHINRRKALNQRVVNLVTTDKLSEYQFIRIAI